MSTITIATSKGGASKTTVARLILGRVELAGFKASAIDADFNHTLTDGVAASAKHPIEVRHELGEAKIVPLASTSTNARTFNLIKSASALPSLPVS